MSRGWEVDVCEPTFIFSCEPTYTYDINSLIALKYVDYPHHRAPSVRRYDYDTAIQRSLLLRKQAERSTPPAASTMTASSSIAAAAATTSVSAASANTTPSAAAAADSMAAESSPANEDRASGVGQGEDEDDEAENLSDLSDISYQSDGDCLNYDWELRGGAAGGTRGKVTQRVSSKSTPCVASAVAATAATVGGAATVGHSGTRDMNSRSRARFTINTKTLQRKRKGKLLIPLPPPTPASFPPHRLLYLSCRTWR